jgi:glycosyltransferase involved in cell wall biosynthesis
MRVALYTDALGIGGAEISLGHLLAALPSDVDVTVMGCAPAVLEHLVAQRPGTPRVLLPFSADPRNLAVAAAHIRAVRRLRPGVFHANLPVPWSGWHGIMAGLACPRTAVVAVEQLPIKTTSAWQRWWKRQLSRRLAAHVAVGEVSARQIEAYAGLPSHRVRTIRNGVPDLGPVRRVTHDGVALVAVGRLNAQKGFDVLLSALAELPDVAVRIVGSGEEDAALAAQAARLGVTGRVTFVGWSTQVRDELAQADVFVLPSRSEGFPLALVEAMLAGLPVVATTVGSVPEAVTDGDTGLLVPKDDPAALTAALRKLIDDPDLRARMGQRARQAATAFTANHMAAEYMTLWRQIT